MGYSYNKAMALKPQKERWLSTFFFALFAAAVMFAPFVITGNGYFTFYGDFDVQQIPFYQMCHNAVRTGDFGWNYATDLGTDFIGSYTFYLLGSPFFWLTVPFPNNIVPYLMAPLLVLKFACAALTAYFYIRRFTKKTEAARLGGMLYAFSGFAIYNIFFNHFHEAIIIFPLLLLSLELLMTENRHGLFAICVFLSAGINYFFFYGMVVFGIIYLVVRWTSGAIKLSFGRFCLIALEAVVGLSASAIILLPTVTALITNNRLTDVLNGWGAITYGKEQIYLNAIQCFFFPPDLPARPVFFPGANVKWSSLGGWLPVFGMIGVFAYCGKNKGSWLKRIICTCFVFAMFPILNSAFSAFNTAYYARWFYMPVLMMCLATVMAAEDREISFKSAIKWSAFITAAFCIVIGFFPTKTDEGWRFGLFTQAYESKMYTARFWISCAIAVGCVIIAAIMLTCFKKKNTVFFNAALSAVLIISVIYGMVFIGGGKRHSYTQRVVQDYLINGEVDLPGDSTQYRIDTFDSPDNTGMYLGYSSINAFHSIVPDSVTEFYKFVGETRSVGSRPDIDNPALRPLLSVKYLLNLEGEDEFVLSDGTTKMSGYTYFGTQNGFKIYQNDNYIPYGFVYDSYISVEDCEKYSAKNRANIMLKAVVLDNEQIDKYGSMLQALDTTALYGFSAEELAADSEARRQGAALSCVFEDDKFTSLVKTEKDALVYFSVPYTNGWTATVNGEQAEIEKVNIGFMAVKVGAGESKIEFTYNTPNLWLGINISVCAAGVFIIYMIICLITRKKRTEVSYPEGEKLLERWIEYDVADALSGEGDYSEKQPEEEKKTSLDTIAEQLNREYPVKVPEGEFTGGFTININNDGENA